MTTNLNLVASITFVKVYSWPLYGSNVHLFDKVLEEEEAKYHPLTRFALMALARKIFCGVPL